MSTLKVHDSKGSAVGELEIADELMEAKRGTQAVRDSVVAYLAGLRAGTASTLRKGEVAGSNKKPWRQKGTGRARAGYRQSPVWRGGGVAFGPHPRSYAQKLNKKVSHLAFRRALTDRIQAGQVKLVETLEISESKTKVLVSLLKSLGVKAPVLLVVAKVEPAVSRAARNIPDVEVIRADDVSVFHLVRYPAIVASRAGMEKIKARLSGTQGEG
jgi:large subunit ribosomal protein L4